MNTRGKRWRAASLEEDKNANFLLHHPRDYILKAILSSSQEQAVLVKVCSCALWKPWLCYWADASQCGRL